MAQHPREAILVKELESRLEDGEHGIDDDDTAAHGISIPGPALRLLQFEPLNITEQSVMQEVSTKYGSSCCQDQTFNLHRSEANEEKALQGIPTTVTRSLALLFRNDGLAVLDTRPPAFPRRVGLGLRQRVSTALAIGQTLEHKVGGNDGDVEAPSRQGLDRRTLLLQIGWYHQMGSAQKGIVRGRVEPDGRIGKGHTKRGSDGLNPRSSPGVNLGRTQVEGHALDLHQGTHPIRAAFGPDGAQPHAAQLADRRHRRGRCPRRRPLGLLHNIGIVGEGEGGEGHPCPRAREVVLPLGGLDRSAGGYGRRGRYRPGRHALRQNDS